MAAAALPAPRADAPKKSGGSFGQFIVAMVVVTILSSALGFVFAPKNLAPQGHGSKGEPAPANETAEVATASHLMDLPPIVTNIGSPQELWVRLEASMIFDPATIQHPETLAAEIANDLLAYLRTVSVSQIQGPIGMQNLRQDLNERAATRSGGAVKELVIRTLVLQ
jgi:flagellar protein FliL